MLTKTEAVQPKLKRPDIAITGPTAGIGRTASLELARRGAQLTLLCRSREKAEALQQEIVSVGGLQPDIIIMDMASP